MTRFYVQDQGVFIPTNDLAQAFAALNFKQLNSLGVGTDTLIPIVNPSNPNWIADIQTQDLWGYTGGGDIYRMTKVGIQNNNPSSTLDITGTVHATGAVDFDSTLNVDGDVTFNSVTSSTNKDTGALVVTSGGVGIEENLNVGQNAKVFGTTSSTTKDTGALIVEGGVGIEENLNVGQNAKVFGTTSSTTKDTGALVVDGGVGIEENLNVGQDAKILGTTSSTTKDTGALIVEGGVGIEENLNVGQNAKVLGTTSSTTKDTGALVVDGGVGIEENLNVGQDAKILGTTSSTTKDTGALVVDGGVGIEENLNVGQDAKILGTTSSTDKDTGALVVDGGVGIEENLNVGGDTVLDGTLELNSSLIDVNNSTATGKFDYRLSSVGTGVSWRPPGVQTQNAIWVTMDGNDANSGYLEGDAKRTVGAAASIAEPGDTIFIRSGVYYENNPIGLRTDVSVSGQDLRLVTIIPNNPLKDVFHVRRGCLVENVSFAGNNVSIAHTGAGAVAFPPTPQDISAGISYGAVTGYLDPGPATEGSSGRWKSPYIRNCTNFMTKSIGMKIDGNHATASTIGADLKSMVCDSFTQYNENGIGVSITNNGYAQLVSIFTINCDIGIFASSGGSCDLTNSNSSFGNFGLYAVGLGSTEFTGIVSTYPPSRTQPGVDAGSDVVTFANMRDNPDNPGISSVRRPYDGQALFFKINLDNYADAVGTGIIQEPMVQVQEIKVLSGGSGFSAASPPTIIIRDKDDLSQQPKGPQGIIAEVSPTIDEINGSIIAIDVVNSGRNYLPTQNLEVFIDGGAEVGAAATVITQPIYYTVDVATEPTPVTGITTVTFNEFIPYELYGNEEVSLKRISRILTSSHSFEYIGTGVDINTSTPFKGAVPVKENEIVALDGAQVPFTSTDQKGNFDIGEGFQINQPTSTIRGRDFSKAIQAEVTPLILALR